MYGHEVGLNRVRLLATLIVVAIPLSCVAIPAARTARPSVLAIRGSCVLVSAIAVWCSAIFQVVLPNQGQGPPAIVLRKNRPISKFTGPSNNYEVLILRWGPAGHGG